MRVWLQIQGLPVRSRSHTFVEIDYEIISPFPWIIQEGLLSVTSESMCMKYWLTACSRLPRKKVWLGELNVPPWPYLLTWDVKQVLEFCFPLSVRTLYIVPLAMIVNATQFFTNAADVSLWVINSMIFCHLIFFFKNLGFLFSICCLIGCLNHVI